MKRTLLALMLTLAAVSASARPMFPYRSMTIYFGSYGAGIDQTLLNDVRTLVSKFVKYGKVDSYMETRNVHALEGERTLCVTPVDPQVYFKMRVALEDLLAKNPRSAYPVASVRNEMESCMSLNNRIGPA